jgi:soluble cytochrome b562
MKIRSLLTWLLALPALSPLILTANAQVEPPTPAGSATPAGPATSAPTDDKKTELELRMDRMGKAYRKLKKQVADPTANASSLNLLSVMQDAANEALQLTPEKAADLPEDQRAKFIEDFKAGIKGMQDLFTKLGDALTTGKNDDAVKIVANIDALEKKDHKEFRKPKND